MGFLRFLLALGVVAEHSDTPFIVGSYTAVEAFFIISGFYMSLILSGRYASAGDFYRSRFFRLLPAYWFALAAALAVYLLTYAATGFEALAFKGLDGWRQAPWLTQVWYFFSQAFMVTSDAGFFFDWNGAPAVFNTLIPPAWTLSLEIMFYLLCPWLVRLPTGALIGVCAAAIAIRVVAYQFGLDQDPWHARFFPFELTFFIVGMLCHRAYAGRMTIHWARRAFQRRIQVFAVAAALLLSAFFYPIGDFAELPAVYQQTDYLRSLALYALIAISLPYLFGATKNSRIDRYIGEYSYPVYLFHYIFVEISANGNFGVQTGLMRFAFVISLTLLSAAFVVHFVQAPIDRYRAKFAVRAAV